jgi:nucleotide-binding universal stress UspA family protein
MTMQSADEAQRPFAPKHILVPVDVDPQADRPLADRLVDDACAFAKLAGARLTLLHVPVPVLSPMSPPVDLMSEAYRSMLDVLEARNAYAGRALKQLEARARAAGVTTATLMKNHAGNVAQTIVDVARDERVDLIMITTHGRRGLKRVLLGSVAERTSHLAGVPILLLPPRAA